MRKRPDREAGLVHRMLKGPCLGLLERQAFQLKPKSQQEAVVRCICEKGPVSVHDICTWLTSERVPFSGPNSVRNQIRNIEDLHCRLSAEWRKVIGEEFRVTIDMCGEGRNTSRYLNIPGRSLEEVGRIADSMRLALGDYEATLFTCLVPIEKVFQLLPCEGPHEWFRKRGPIGVDFQEGRVYRDEGHNGQQGLLDELKNLVLGNPFYLLKGISATGKSVLARTLAYDLYYTQHIPVYYFKCGEKSFTDGELCEDIRKATGLVIVEDIHLAALQANAVYARLPRSDDRHVLFTARLGFEEGLQREFDQLSHCPSKELQSFGYADCLVGFYLEKHGIELPEDDRRNLKKVSQESFWLLAYALEGYKPGTNPSKWVEEGVKDDLASLRKVDARYPEALLALSPLYRNEVLTAEAYLTARLHLDPNVFKDLVIRGEVTRIEMRGHVFCGLPHSALADAYWDHGRTVYLEPLARREGVAWGRGSEYEDYLSEYMIWPAHNRLEVLAEAPRDLHFVLKDRLLRGGHLVEALREEVSPWGVAASFRWWTWYHDIDSAVLSALADKVGEAHDLWQVYQLMTAVSDASPEDSAELWGKLDLAALARLINLGETLEVAGWLIEGVLKATPKASAELCRKLNLGTLADAVKRARHAGGAASLLKAVFRANRSVGKNLVRHLNFPQFAKDVSLFPLKDSRALLRSLKAVDPEKACELVLLVPDRKLRESLLQVLKEDGV